MRVYLWTTIVMSQENGILYRAWGWGEASMEALLRGNIVLPIDLAISMLLDTCHKQLTPYTDFWMKLQVSL